MTKTILYAPVHIIGGKPQNGARSIASGGAANNPDAAPCMTWRGSGYLDDRLLFSLGNRPDVFAGGTPAVPNVIGWYNEGLTPLVDQAPAALAAANIAAAANVATGVAMTLAGASTGITLVAAGGFTALPSLVTVPAGALVLDGLPQYTKFGGAFQTWFYDPTTAVSRAVKIVGSASATGGNFLVTGNDYYGNTQTETITAGAGAVTTAGKKAFKFIQSVVPAFTDAHNYSVGTTDVYGFHMAADIFAYVDVYWVNVIQLVATFVAADATSPATSTTGDPRGTFAAGSASDGTKKLQVFIAQTLSRAKAGTVFGVPTA